MKLERYNQMVFALVATGALLGGLLLLIAGAMDIFLSYPPPGVIVNDGGSKNKQLLAFCPAITENGGTYQYIPVGAISAENSSKDVGLSRMRVPYKQGHYPIGISCAGVDRVFNVVIRNLRTNDQHLLLNAPALITSLNIPDAECAAGKGSVPCEVLQWEIRSTDSNHDGRINEDDASVAYLSNLSAHQLQPVTPADALLLSSSWQPGSTHLTFRIRRDVNNDGQYTSEDGAEILEADATTRAPAHSFIDDVIMRKLRAAVE